MDKNTSNHSTLSPEQKARRNLLKMSMYVPPAMLGVMVNSSVAWAGPLPLGTTVTCDLGGGITQMITVSAGGQSCCPCVPGSVGYWDPIKGKYKKKGYSLKKCNATSCALGNCQACQTVVFKKPKDCTKKMAKSGCACTCSPAKNSPPLPGSC